MPAITPCIWSDGLAEEQAQYYCSIFPNSRIVSTSLVTPAVASANGAEVGSVLVMEIELDGRRFSLLNGGPGVPHNPAISFQIFCADQAQVDHYWHAFGEDGTPSVCGWVADRYGVHWQIVPQVFMDVMAGDDAAAKGRVIEAMLPMACFDVAAIEAAV